MARVPLNAVRFDESIEHELIAILDFLEASEEVIVSFDTDQGLVEIGRTPAEFEGFVERKSINGLDIFQLKEAIDAAFAHLLFASAQDLTYEIMYHSGSWIDEFFVGDEFCDRLEALSRIATERQSVRMAVRAYRGFPQNRKEIFERAKAGRAFSTFAVAEVLALA